MKNKKTICLNMIVKNESAVIKRCLDSVKSLIDSWVIVDTGSTDGTQEIIREYLKEIPGELHERPWVNFARNRNEALLFARGRSDYLLLIDADDRLVISEDFTLPPLEADIYTIIQQEEMEPILRKQSIYFLVRNEDCFEWEGVLHEYLKYKKEKPLLIKELGGLFNQYIHDGSRAKNPHRIEEDIALLKKAMEEQPDNGRHVFYLGRTYWANSDYSSAIHCFKKRAEMGGDPMEVYFSLHYIGLGQQLLKQSPDLFIQSFCKAWLYRPSRKEALYEVARHYSNVGNYLLGYLVTKQLIAIPPTEDTLFVESWIDDWGAPIYLFICASHLGKKEEAQDALKKVLRNPRLPADIRKEYQLDQWAKHFNII